MTEEQIVQDRQQAMEKEYGKSQGGNFFNYVDVSRLEREGITQWKPAVGSSQIRIVFPPTRPGFYGLEIYKHSNVGSSRKTFLCKRRMFDETCPICEFQDLLRKEDPSDSAIKELNAGRRYLFFIVDISSQENEKLGVRWFDCPITLFNEIKSRSKRKRKRGEDEDANFSKYVDVSSPTDGRDISFEQVKEKSKYTYVGVELETGTDIPKAWYDDLPEFVDILKLSDVEEMLDAVGDQFEAEEPKDEPKDEPAVRGGTTRESARTQTKMEDTEIEDEVEEEPRERRSERVREAITEEKEPVTRDFAGAGAKDEENDMKSRVQARLKKAREKRSQGE